MVKTNYIFAGIMILVALFFYIVGIPYTEGAEKWPQFFSILLIILSIALCVDTYFKPNREKNNSEKSKDNMKENKYVLYTISFSVIYLILMNYIGFLILTPIFLWFLFTLLKYKSIKGRFFLSIGLTIGIIVIFQYVLKIPIPQGLLSNFFI